MSCSQLAGRLAVTIEKVREASLNPDLRILVGGHAFISEPDLAREVGADAMATDGQDAVRKAHALDLAAVRHA
jgi:methanogenic corrinoid protein MtbC1